VLTLPMTKLTARARRCADTRRFDLDLLAGVRVWDVSAKTDSRSHARFAHGRRFAGAAARIVRDIAFRLNGITLPGNVIDGSQRTLEESERAGRTGSSASG